MNLSEISALEAKLFPRKYSCCALWPDCCFSACILTTWEATPKVLVQWLSNWHRPLPNEMQKKKWTAIARTEFVVCGSNNHHFVKFTLDTETPFTVCNILFLLGPTSIFCLWNYRYILQKSHIGIKLFCEAVYYSGSYWQWNPAEWSSSLARNFVQKKLLTTESKPFFLAALVQQVHSS